MNRRNFISLSTASLAGLLISNSAYSFPFEEQLLIFPKRVYVMLDDGIHKMQSSPTQLWTYQDVFIQLKYINGAMHVEVGSPKTPLSSIRMEWDHATTNNTTILGDALERSYGDLQFQPPDPEKKMPWYFIQHGSKETICFGVKTGPASLCFWHVGKGSLQLTLDTRNGGRGVNLGHRTLVAAKIIATKSRKGENSFATARRFCTMMCEKPLLPKKPVYGINDWYITYGANSADIILEHTARMTDLALNKDNRPFSVVDSGWAFYSPLLPNDCCWQDDFSRPNDHFRDMALLADKIKKLEMRPGLWTRPLCAAHDDSKNLLLPVIPGRESPKKPVLDPSIAENLARIYNNIDIYRQWGYELVKHDFTTYDMLGKWGNKMQDDITTAGWGFNDGSKTTAEIILTLYQTIRDAAKGIYLLGCNTMSHLSAGIFEINRIGDDTSGREWERTKTMGVNTLGFRMVQHNTFYSADGDCVGLTNAVPWTKNKQWMELLAKSSTPLFISAQQAATGAEQREAIKQAFSLASAKLPVGEPLDWMTEQRPKKWRLDGGVENFEW